MRDLKANRAFANTLSALNRLRPLVGMGPRPESDRSLSKETGSLSKTSKNIFKIPAPPKRETVRDAVVINDDENIDNETENIGNTTRRTGQRNAPRRWSYPYPSTYVPEEKRNSATRKRRSDEGAASSRRGNKKKETISKDLDEEKLREKPSRRSEKKNGVSKKKNSKGETPLHVATIKVKFRHRKKIGISLRGSLGRSRRGHEPFDSRSGSQFEGQRRMDSTGTRKMNSKFCL